VLATSQRLGARFCSIPHNGCTRARRLLAALSCASDSRALATPEFKRLRDQRGLYPFSATGLEAEAFVKSSAIGYRQLAAQFGLLQP